MQEKTKRPTIILITQITLGLFILYLASAPFLNLYALIIYLTTDVFSDNSTTVRHVIIGYSFVIIVLFGILALFLSSFWGLLKRKSYGRWLSLMSIILVLSIMIISQVFKPQIGYVNYEIITDTELTIFYTITIIIDILFLLLVLFLIFSKKVKTFFESPPKIER